MAQGLGQGKAGQVPTDQFVGFRIDPGNDVAHNDQIRRRMEVFRAVAQTNGDPQFFQKGAHGRIHRLVGTGDAVALFLQHPGQGAHAGAADAHEVDVVEGGGDFVIYFFFFLSFPSGSSLLNFSIFLKCFSETGPP